MNRAPVAIALAALSALALAGCAQDLPAAGDTASASATPTLSGSITVDAAASLNEVFPALAKEFQAEHPGTTITFSFGGSSTLAAQIVSGAPVDVFAAASTKTMRTVQDAHLAGEPTVIARNELEIAVPKGNPGGITGLRDFGDADRTVVVCDKEVPCGAAAQQVFDLGGVTAKPDSYEPDVTSVLTKVRTGNADAGLVYVTDVRAAGDEVQGIPFDEADQAITDYPIATVTGTRNAALADAWVAYVAAHERDLQAAGFLPPQ
jgi:molybdate transport system substrate-binding protein